MRFGIKPTDQNYVPAWTNKGNTLCNLNRYKEAIHACDRALTIDQNHVHAWVTKGTALRNLKRYAELIQAYDRAPLLPSPNNLQWGKCCDKL